MELKAEAELHRIKTKANKLDRMEGLLLHYENFHSWKKSNVQPLLLKIKQEKLRKLEKAKQRKQRKPLLKKKTKKEQTKNQNKEDMIQRNSNGRY